MEIEEVSLLSSLIKCFASGFSDVVLKVFLVILSGNSSVLGKWRVFPEFRSHDLSMNHNWAFSSRSCLLTASSSTLSVNVEIWASRNKSEVLSIMHNFPILRTQNKRIYPPLNFLFAELSGLLITKKLQMVCPLSQIHMNHTIITWEKTIGCSVILQKCKNTHSSPKLIILWRHSLTWRDLFSKWSHSAKKSCIWRKFERFCSLVSQTWRISIPRFSRFTAWFGAWGIPEVALAL